MAYCAQCGKQLGDDQAFCSGCGHASRAAAQPAAGAATDLVQSCAASDGAKGLRHTPGCSETPLDRAIGGAAFGGVTGAGLVSIPHAATLGFWGGTYEGLLAGLLIGLIGGGLVGFFGPRVPD